MQWPLRMAMLLLPLPLEAGDAANKMLIDDNTAAIEANDADIAKSIADIAEGKAAVEKGIMDIAANYSGHRGKRC